LGLASARRLVEGSGGVITCESTLGVGTSFTIWLPAYLSPEESRTTVAASVGEATRWTATVLLCEDDAHLRRLARQVLARHGFDILETVSAEDALETRSRYDGHIDVLVTDVVLPEMSGPELAQRLQGDEGDLLVVIMSGTASPDVISHLRPGSATFLAKPFRPSALVDEVVGLLARRRAALA
jgi:two-component system, cell cycle sensor histidine kinase and response regulator CckA